MHTWSRSILLGSFVILAILCIWIHFFDLGKLQKPNVTQLGTDELAEKSGPLPIEAAYEKVHIGMPMEALYKLMAPYEEISTGHRQWPEWVNGHSRVCVTLSFPSPGRVESKSMDKEVFDQRQGRWISFQLHDPEDDRIVIGPIGKNRHK
jgi:hypothetical protein